MAKKRISIGREAISEEVKRLFRDGFKPWGLVLRLDPEDDAPAGSLLFQYKRGGDDAAVVLAPDGSFVRGGVTVKGRRTEIAKI